MSSMLRRIELKILRKKGLLPPRYKAVNLLRGVPYRNCEVVKDAEGNVISWTRYH